MATTTNYGWTTPDDTALVKDGAAAIRTLGTSIDTTTKNLNPSTTLGDIEYRSSTANTNTRLGIGSTGNVLTVSGGVPTWAVPASGGMTLISTTTLTGASITLSSIPQDYKNLQVIIRNYKPATDGDYVKCYINNDSNANRYRSVQTAVSNTTFNQSFVDNTIAANDNSVDTGLTVIDIRDYTNSTTWKMVEVKTLGVDSTTTTNQLFVNSIALYNQTTAITSLVFFPNAGNFTSGTILLYGVK
jgi:hypothetical protein